MVIEKVTMTKIIKHYLQSHTSLRYVTSEQLAKQDRDDVKTDPFCIIQQLATQNRRTRITKESFLSHRLLPVMTNYKPSFLNTPQIRMHRLLEKAG